MHWNFHVSMCKNLHQHGMIIPMQLQLVWYDHTFPSWLTPRLSQLIVKVADNSQVPQLVSYLSQAFCKVADLSQGLHVVPFPLMIGRYP